MYPFIIIEKAVATTVCVLGEPFKAHCQDIQVTRSITDYGAHLVEFGAACIKIIQNVGRVKTGTPQNVRLHLW